MSKLTELTKERDIKVDKKNQLLKLKWNTEEKISEINRDKLSYQNKHDYLAIDRANLRVRTLQNELYLCDKEIKDINKELNELEILIENEKIIEVNSNFVKDRNLSSSDIKSYLDASKHLSEKYQSIIVDYSRFLNKLDSSSKELNDDSFNDYLNQIKVKIETKRELLLSNKEQCIKFDQIQSLEHNFVVANRNLQTAKTDFSMSKIIVQNINSVIDDFVDFLNDSNSKLKKMDDKFISSDLNQIRTEIENKIAELSEFKEQCFKLNRLDDLNDAGGTAQNDLAKIKKDFNQSLNKSKNLSIKFDNFMKYYSNFLNSFNSRLEEVEEKFWYDDFNLMRREIMAKVDSLLHFQDLCVEHSRLDDFSEAITNTRKDLAKIKSDFNQSIDNSKRLSDKFDSTIGNYYSFLSKLNSGLEEFDDEFLTDVFNQMILGTKTKVADLFNSQEIYSENRRMDDLNYVLDEANEDLEKIRANFVKIINKNLNNLIMESKSMIESKSFLYSEFNSKLLDLIGNVNNLNVHIDKHRLLNDLDGIKISLNKEFEKLNDIESDLHKVIENSIDIHLVNEGTDRVKTLIDKLNDLDFEKFENMIVEAENNYATLSDLNFDYDSKTIEDLLNELDKCFNRPMFMRQLKRYDLDDEDLTMVKNDIVVDITNQLIGEGADIKEIIKARCEEFRKYKSEIDEDEINDLLNSFNVEGIDEDIVRECKDKVKQDFLEGTISINNVELKFNYYVNKKVNEAAQLNELEIIKNDPNVPNIKIHLTPEETNEIYVIAEQEIISEYGIRGNVENHVYYLINQKIRENQSEARGRLNIIKRDFSNLTRLNKKQQMEFVHQIEFHINNNEIKYYEISEEYIVKLSNDFINYGKLRLR